MEPEWGAALGFFMPMEPPETTAQMRKASARGGRVRFYDPPEVAEAKGRLEAALAPHRPPEPLSGPLALSVTWSFRPRGCHRHGEPRATRPDTDNLEKALKDCMTRLRFWNDDAQVAEEHVRKYWSDVPGIRVDVAEIG